MEDLRELAFAHVARRVAARISYAGDSLEEAARDITRLEPLPCEGFEWTFTVEDIPELVSRARALLEATGNENTGYDYWQVSQLRDGRNDHGATDTNAAYR